MGLGLGSGLGLGIELRAHGVAALQKRFMLPWGSARHSSTSLQSHLVRVRVRDGPG